MAFGRYATPSHLPATLAQRIQFFREQLGVTGLRLAQMANLPAQEIEDIEGGLTLFLSAGVRQKLARVLKVKPSLLKEVEKDIQAIDYGLQQKALSPAGRDRLMEELLHFPNQPVPCPSCGTTLSVRLFQRRDLEDNPLVEVKAHCPKCLFRL